MVRWVSRRCRLCCKIFVLVIVIVVIAAAFFIHHVVKTESCTDEISLQMLRNLCSLYEQREVDGSYCHKLCHTQELTYDSCTNYKHGKKVLFMTCQHCEDSGYKHRVVFKMKEDLEMRDQLDHMITPDGNTADEINHFIGLISNMVTHSYWYKFAKNMSAERDILSYTWGWDFHEFMEKSSMPRKTAVMLAAQSIWSLSEQHEYLISKLLQDKSFLPRIYGTCGPAYFTEFTHTLRKYEYEFFDGWSQSWDERAILAVKLIDLIARLDTELHEPLHICDVKPDNFGMRKNWEVTLIDTDCALFNTDLLMQFNHSKCVTHEDCDFFDCRGYCNIKQGRCLRKRVNNNLQTLCEDVFQGLSAKFPTGLLRDPPSSLKTQLYTVLQECAYPDSASGFGDVRGKAPTESGTQLRQLLVNSIRNTELAKLVQPQ